MTEHRRGRDEADADLLGPTTELISLLSSQAHVHESLGFHQRGQNSPFLCDPPFWFLHTPILPTAASHSSGLPHAQTL